MLEPHERTPFLTSLRPPEGYVFDRLIATTYSLDLDALLVMPLALTLFDWRRPDGELVGGSVADSRDPLTLLESLRRTASRMHVFVEAGRVCAPTRYERLFMALEEAVIEVRAPKDGPQEASFHPKVTFVRFDSPGYEPYYRMLVASRNLTLDRSWDTLLVLEGFVNSRRSAPIQRNKPIGAFVRALPDMSVKGDERAREACGRLADELEQVEWEVPEPFDDMRFHALGLRTDERKAEENVKRIFGGEARSWLVISPFIDERFLSRLSSRSTPDLVSTTESLTSIAQSPEAKNWKPWVLDEACNDLAPDAAANAGDESPQRAVFSPMSGLHAKVFAADDGRYSRIITGSANATMRAFGRNVEFLVELQGTTGKVGPDAIRGSVKDGDGLSAVLREVSWGALAPRPDDPAQRKAEEILDAARRAIAVNTWIAEAEAVDERRFRSKLRAKSPFEVPVGAVVHVHPCSLAADSREVNSADNEIIFGPHSLDALTAFYVFEIEARSEGATARSALAVRAQLIGAPSDRVERLLASLISDTRTLLRFLRLMLADDPEYLGASMMRMLQEGSEAAGASLIDEDGVLESMLRTLHRSPERLHSIDRLIADLQATDAGRAIVPAGLDRIWPAIREVLLEVQRPAKGPDS